MEVDIPALRWPEHILRSKWEDTRANLRAWVESRAGARNLVDVPSPILSELLAESPMFTTLRNDSSLYSYPAYAPRYLTRLFQASPGKFFAVILVGPFGRRAGSDEADAMAIGCAMDNLMGVACHVEYSLSCFTVELTVKAGEHAARAGEMLFVEIEILETKGRIMRVVGRVHGPENDVVMKTDGKFFRTDLPPPDSKDLFPMYQEAEEEVNAIPERNAVTRVFSKPAAFCQLEDIFLKQGFQPLSSSVGDQQAWEFGLGKRVVMESFVSADVTLHSIVHFTEYSLGAPGRINGGCTLTVLAEAAKDFLRAWYPHAVQQIEQVTIVYKQPVWVRTVSAIQVKKVDKQLAGDIVLWVELFACKEPEQEGWRESENYLAATARVKCKQSASKL